MLLSTGNQGIREQIRLPPTNCSPLLFAITTFLEEWFSSPAKTSKATHVNFTVTANEPATPSEQSTYILNEIMIPLLPCRLIVDKVYQCKTCKSTTTMHFTFTSIPVSVSKNGLYLERDLIAFFGHTSSDLLCSSCNKPTTRHIEVVEWPQVLLINIDDSEKATKLRKPPGPLSLAQFSSWGAVACTSASIYNLTCFNSIIQSGGHEIMVRATKVKKSWMTSTHKRMVGESEQLQRLYAHSRKYDGHAIASRK